MLSGSLLALFVIGPVFHQVELIVLAVVEWLLKLPVDLGGLVYGCFGQLLGIFGIHHILNFLEISMLSQTGWNRPNPIGTCGNMAQAGAVLAVAIKSRNTKMKQIAYPSAFSATLGIAEPAAFGVTLRLGRPFIMSMIGGGVGGFLASILGLKATGMALTGIPGALLYLNNQLPLYILTNLTNVAAMAAAFVPTDTIGYKEEPETVSVPSGSPSATPSTKSAVQCVPGTVYAPVSGPKNSSLLLTGPKSPPPSAPAPD